MSQTYTCLRGLHHLTSEEMYVLEWKRRNRKQTQPTLYTVPAERRLKRGFFLSSVRPADFPAKFIRCSEWQHRQNLASHNCAVKLHESLAKGHTSPWAAWRCLHRLRTGVTCSKRQRMRWKYFNGDTICECGQAPETTKHMLHCPLLAHPCTGCPSEVQRKCKKMC